MAQISGPFLQTLNTGVNTAFNQFLQAAPSQYMEVAMDVTSTSRTEFYPKLDEIPGLREWLGERVVHNLSLHSFAIPNRTFEMTLGIDREDIEDDQFGIFNIGMQQLGREAGILPDLLVFGLLKAGASTLCYDGQNFFDVDHISYTAAGQPIPYANLQTPPPGTAPGPAWFLMDTTRPMKSLIFQRRRPFTITSRMNLEDENVFRLKRYEWGTDGRCAAGFGIWQTAAMSTAPLTIANYEALRTAMGTIRRIDGAPYGITPNLLVVPPLLEGRANALINNDLISQLNADGATYSTVNNPWKGSARVVKVPYLA